MISIKNVSFKYNNTYVLDDVNLNIDDGGFYFIYGENGSGKSTLIKLILNLLKPSSGTITAPNPPIGYLHQNLDLINTAFPVNVYELLSSYLRSMKSHNMGEIDIALKILDICSLKNKTISSLSGGQLQKVLLCRTFLGNPQTIILDEPSNNLDEISINKLYTHLNDEHRVGKTIIVTEHNIDVIKQYGHDLLLCSNNKIQIVENKEYLK